MPSRPHARPGATRSQRRVPPAGIPRRSRAAPRGSPRSSPARRSRGAPQHAGGPGGDEHGGARQATSASDSSRGRATAVARAAASAASARIRASESDTACHGRDYARIAHWHSRAQRSRARTNRSGHRCECSADGANRIPDRNEASAAGRRRIPRRIARDIHRSRYANRRLALAASATWPLASDIRAAGIPPAMSNDEGTWFELRPGGARAGRCRALPRQAEAEQAATAMLIRRARAAVRRDRRVRGA